MNPHKILEITGWFCAKYSKKKRRVRKALFEIWHADLSRFFLSHKLLEIRGWFNRKGHKEKTQGSQSFVLSLARRFEQFSLILVNSLKSVADLTAKATKKKRKVRKALFEIWHADLSRFF